MTLLLLAGCAGNSPLNFEMSDKADRPLVTAEIHGPMPKLAPEKILAFGLLGQPPLLGRYQGTAGRLSFQPAFPLLPGVRYQAVLTLPGNAPAKAFFALPALPTLPPTVTEIFPTTDLLPANHLKFYLRFSEPMEQGGIFKHLRLRDANGTAVPEPYRETELWSADGRRLTLWFHPGRQKTGVNLNTDLGPVLRPGHRYTLEISGQWKSRTGTPLGVNVLKHFRAVAADRAKLDPAYWTVSASPEVVALKFDEPLDWALLQTQVAIQHADGRPIAGSIKTMRAERWCLFQPGKPLAPGRYEAIIGWELEDLAGNNLQRPFEVDLTKSAQPGRALPARIPFTVN